MPEADNTGVAGAPSWSEALPPRIAISSFSIIFCKRRKVIRDWMSSKSRPALIAS